MHSENGLVTDMSFYNESKTYRHIVVSRFNNQKVVAIRPNPRTDKTPLSQYHTKLYQVLMVLRDKLLDELTQLQDSESEHWVKIIKVFSQKYDKVMKVIKEIK